jgi:hypothetical protein
VRVTVELIFKAKNKQAAAAGKPPAIDANTAGKYHGYFENSYGEQLIFVYDRESKSGVLWHGDAGWQKSYSVIDGLVPELVLSEQEEMWLQACWNAATEFEEK